MYRILHHFFHFLAPQERSVRYHWLMFVMFCLLVSACSPPPPENRVRHLAAIGDTIYYDYPDYPGYHDIETSNESQILQSKDGGGTWHASQDVPPAVSQYFASPPSLPITECVASTPHICYRITGQAQIDQTTDDGESWTTVWASPSNRHSFMRRFVVILDNNNYGRQSPNVIPQDIAISDFGNGEHMVAAAMDNEGVLVLTSAGESSRHGIKDAKPTPYHFTSVYQAIKSTLREILILVLAILIVNPFYLALFRTFLLKKRTQVLVKIYLVLLGIGYLLSIILGQPTMFYVLLFPFWLLFIFVVVLLPTLSGTLTPREWQLLLGSYFCFAIIAHLYFRTKERKPSRLLNLAAFFLAYLPFPLWALGIIPDYPIAFGLSLVLASGTWLIGYQLTNKRKHLEPTVESQV